MCFLGLNWFENRKRIEVLILMDVLDHGRRLCLAPLNVTVEIAITLMQNIPIGNCNPHLSHRFGLLN